MRIFVAVNHVKCNWYINVTFVSFYDSAALLELLRINQFSQLKIFINNIYTSLEHVRLLLRSCCQVDYIIGTKLYYQVSEALFMHVRPI